MAMRVEPGPAPPPLHWNQTNSAAPIATKCSSGSRRIDFNRTVPEPAGESWRVPNRRRVGALLKHQRGARQRLDAESLGVVGSPPRRRDLDHAGVIERTLLGVELRVVP